VGEKGGGRIRLRATYALEKERRYPHQHVRDNPDRNQRREWKRSVKLPRRARGRSKKWMWGDRLRPVGLEKHKTSRAGDYARSYLAVGDGKRRTHACLHSKQSNTRPARAHIERGLANAMK